MVDIVEVSAVAAAAGVLVGVIYYILDIRNQTKMRQTDLVMRLHLHACQKETMEAYQKMLNTKFNDYNDFAKKFGTLTAEGPEQTAIQMSGMFLEGIGILLHKKLVDVDTIRELFPVESAWKKLEPLIVGYRKEQGRPEVYEWFEYLHEEVKKREQQQARVKNG